MSFTAQLATAAGGDKKQAEAILQAMRDVIMDNLQKDGKVRTLGFFLARVNVKTEKPACRKIVFGKAVNIPHKASVKVVRLIPYKQFRMLQ